MRFVRRRVASFALLFTFHAGCNHAHEAVVSPLLVQGTYVLESVTGRGAASGTIVLAPTGGVVRRVRYARSAVPSAEYVAVGTFRLSPDGVVELRLREDDGRSPYVWEPRATLGAGVLRIQYPDPADGPDIVESYRRQ
jgi:hypothetical protein